MIQPNVYIKKTNNTIIKIAVVVGTITAIAGGYLFFINNIWKPKIEVLSIDYDEGVAKIKSGKKVIDIYGDASFSIVGEWGIQFGSTKDGIYDRLELTRKGLVVDYINKVEND